MQFQPDNGQSDVPTRRYFSSNHMTDLFQLLPSSKALHQNFLALRDSALHRPVRDFMNDIYHRMGDPNGGFLRNFQGNGFHARVFELAVYEYLSTAGFSVDHSHDQPDFLITKGNETICFEATTTNPPDRSDRDISIFGVQPLTGEELFEKIYREFPKRILSSLSKKVRHHYHKLPQCKGRPLVVAVGPYFEPGSVTMTDDALVYALYGVGETYGMPISKEPFFDQPQNRTISAILYTNQYTVPRFFRLADGALDQHNVTIFRQGYCMIDVGPTHEYLQYRYQVGHPSAPIETWGQGVTLFLNQNAMVPIDAEALPSTSVFSVKEGGLYRDVRGIHTLTSFMVIHHR